MRIALISDIHGNDVALDAVLADIARSGVDEVLCLGDVATLGPNPNEAIARLRDLGCRCVLGNHDEFLLDAELVATYTSAPPLVAAIDWCRARTSAEELSWLRSFERVITLDLEGGQRLLLFHGSPRSHMEDLLATTPAEALNEALDGYLGTHALMAGGHTHIQMLRQHEGTLLLNPGSVGMPFVAYVGRTGGAPRVMPHAEYAIATVRGGRVEISLRRVDIDLARMREAIAASDYPLGPFVAPVYA